jgi:hypothetical protein
LKTERRWREGGAGREKLKAEKEMQMSAARAQFQLFSFSAFLSRFQLFSFSAEALAKPPSSVLQAPYSEVRIQYSEREPSHGQRVLLF